MWGWLAPGGVVDLLVQLAALDLDDSLVARQGWKGLARKSWFGFRGSCLGNGTSWAACPKMVVLSLGGVVVIDAHLQGRLHVLLWPTGPEAWATLLVWLARDSAILRKSNHAL